MKNLEISRIIIINPSSQSGRTGKNKEILFNALTESFKNSKIIFTKKPGDGKKLARQYLKKGYKEILAVGGDGTINEVGNGFFEIINGDKPDLIKNINPKAIFSILPAGTRNVFANSLGLPQEFEQCVDSLSKLKPKKIDVITAIVTNPISKKLTKPRICFNAVEIGAAAEIIQRSKKVRSKINSRLISTITGIISTVPTYTSNMFEITIDDKITIDQNVTICIIANGKYLGGQFKVAPQSSMSDGYLDVILLLDSGSLMMLDGIVRMKSGNYFEKDNILYFKAKKIHIKSKERSVSISVDGEPIGVLPATFQILHKKLLMKF